MAKLNVERYRFDGLHFDRQAQCSEAEKFRAGGQQMAHMVECALFFEARDEHRFAIRMREPGDRLCRDAAEVAIQMIDILYEIAADFYTVQRMENVERIDDAVRIVNGNRSVGGDFGDQRTRRLDGQGVRHGFVDGAASAVVAKSFNWQWHALRPGCPIV